MASGWDKVSPLLDPFCGSGTIPIEAALMALGIPPGINRRFAFMDWPGYDESLWQDTARGWQKCSRQSARDPGLRPGRRRDQNGASQCRTRRGGGCTSSSNARLSRPSLRPTEPGWVVTNPPYGLRISEGKDLRNLYAQFGNVLRANMPGLEPGGAMQRPGPARADADQAGYFAVAGQRRHPCQAGARDRGLEQKNRRLCAKLGLVVWKARISNLASPNKNTQVLFLKVFQFDPGCLEIKFPVTRQAQLLIGNLGIQFGFQQANLRL